MGKQKVALVLSIDWCAWYCTYWSHEELLRHNYEITSIAGSSMGAMVQGDVCFGKTGRMQRMAV